MSKHIFNELRSPRQGKCFRCTWPGCGKGYTKEEDQKEHEQLHSSSSHQYLPDQDSSSSVAVPAVLYHSPNTPATAFAPSEHESSDSQDDGEHAIDAKVLKLDANSRQVAMSANDVYLVVMSVRRLYIKDAGDPSPRKLKDLLNQIREQEIQLKNLQDELDATNDIKTFDEALQSTLSDINQSVAYWDFEGNSSSEAGDADATTQKPESEELLNTIREQAAQIRYLLQQLETRRGSVSRSPPPFSLPLPASSVVPMSPEPSSSAISDNRRSQIDDLIVRLAQIFSTKEEYRQLLSCRGTNAQKLLNMFQQLLDLMDNQPSSIHRNLITAAQRLSGSSGMYPTCYELDGVTETGFYECSGGFADVYKGYFRGQAVCLKTIRLNSRTDSERFLKVFAREAILWGQLRHPNILPFYGIYRIKDRISFVAPWMENGDITRYLKQNENSNRVLLSFDVTQGLQFLHKNDIVHGDLKGGNILVNEFGRACLADLGLSSISDEEILAWTSYSSAASKGGTVRWQAPELFNPEGDDEIHNTKASDIYAWACVAYEIFTGEVPLAHLVRDATIVHKVLSGERPRRPSDLSLSWHVWGLTEGIWKLMETCWDVDPVKRPNVTFIIEHLETALPTDAQRNAQTVSISPGQFREMARDKMQEADELSVEMLSRAHIKPIGVILGLLGTMTSASLRGTPNVMFPDTFAQLRIQARTAHVERMGQRHILVSFLNVEAFLREVTISMWPGCGRGYAGEADQKYHEELHSSSPMQYYLSPQMVETPEMPHQQEILVIDGDSKFQGDNMLPGFTWPEGYDGSKDEGAVKTIL
ncbi:hypothetical protein H0H92_012156 [Tricholoma furcatifolium]|nr:hypothetical protein H0H92_012156 [Tricholoma furcatifolium]